MRIWDFEGAHDATTPTEVEAVLNKRYGAGLNSFWIGHEDGKFPAMNIMVNGDIAYVHYFPKQGHPGLASVGSVPCLRSGEFTEFFPSESKESLDIMNEAIVPVSDALKAAQEFAASKTLPKCIQWNSLVEGE
jgi:hypothetical protein